MSAGDGGAALKQTAEQMLHDLERHLFPARTGYEAMPKGVSLHLLEARSHLRQALDEMERDSERERGG